MKTTLFIIAATITTFVIGNPIANNVKVTSKKASNFVKTTYEKITNPTTLNVKGDESEDPFAQVDEPEFNSDFIGLDLETGVQDFYEVGDEVSINDVKEGNNVKKLEGGRGIGYDSFEEIQGIEEIEKFEEIEKRSVHGRDSREQTRHTKEYPHRLIGQLYFKTSASSGWYSCSATMVNYRSILTNGHCVCSGSGSWYNSFRFYPARDADGGFFGTYISGVYSYTTSNYFYQKDYTYDYAVIRLKYNIGNTLGWLGLWSIGDNELSNSGTKSIPLILEGYPGDKPSGTNWFGACNVYVKNYASIYHTCDTAGGQSGSALTSISGGYRYIIGVHNLGYSAGAGYNRAVRLSSSRFNQINSWLN